MKIKRIYVAILAAVMAVSCAFMSACRDSKKTGGVSSLLVDLHSYMPTKNTTPTPESPVVVQASRLIAEEYEKETGVKINWAESKPVNGLTTEVSEWYVNQIGGERCPVIGFSWGTRFQDRGYYLDLTEYLDRPNKYVSGNEHWKDMFPSYLWNDYEIADATGRIVAVPITLNPGPANGLFYNKSIFEGLEQPKNWEEFNSVMDAIENKGKTPIAPWSNFKYVGLDQWITEYSISPAFAKKLMDKTDKDGDGRVSVKEELEGVKAGLYNPEISSAAKAMYNLAKTYYKNRLPQGWTNTDYSDKWLLGSIGMMENGLWNIQTENNKTVRSFEYGIFPAPVVDNKTSDYAAEIDWVSIDEYNSHPSLMLNIMRPAVTDENGNVNAELVEQAIDFLMYLTIPDNITMIVQEHGGSLGAVNGTVPNSILNDWLEQEFPQLPNARWPLGYTTEYTSTINRRFAEWVNGTINDNAFYKAVNEAQQAGVDEFARKMGISLS